MEQQAGGETPSNGVKGAPAPDKKSGFWRSLRRIVGAESGLLRSHPRFGLAVIAVAVFPALYLVIYLGGVWDPAARTTALTVGVVDLDRGTEYHGHFANAGTDLSKSLLADGTFRYRFVDNESEARAAVDAGGMAFAIVIPADFSANAVPGRNEGAGHIRILFSEGNNYSEAAIVRRFASELGHKANETLNEARWEAVLQASGKSIDELDKLRDGVARLASGAAELDNGVATYRDAVKSVAEGFSATAGAVRTMRDKLPPNDRLAAFRQGARELADGQHELDRGIARLSAGSGKLTNGLHQLTDKTRTIPIVGPRISNGATELGNGSEKLRSGLRAARTGSRKLVGGADALSDGASQLVDGMTKLGDGIRLLASRLPEDEKLTAFADGADRLSDGASRLRDGVELLKAALPDKIETLDGDAAGLANSIEPQLVNLAPVANNGMAFAPSMLSVAAWVGAVVLANMFSLRSIRADSAGAPRLAKATGKLALPLAMVLVQAALLSVITQYWLDIPAADPAGFWITTFVVSATFMTVIFALLRMTGDAGKLVAVLLLTLQLTAGGGILPVELTAHFYQAVHDWLPFTFAVQAYRASLFGALGGDWRTPTIMLGTMFAMALAVSVAVGRWRIVDGEAYKPGLDL